MKGWGRENTGGRREKRILERMGEKRAGAEVEDTNEEQCSHHRSWAGTEAAVWRLGFDVCENQKLNVAKFFKTMVKTTQWITISSGAADALLADAGGFRLDAESWLPKPGLARHMGVARLKL